MTMPWAISQPQPGQFGPEPDPKYWRQSNVPIITDGRFDSWAWPHQTGVPPLGPPRFESWQDAKIHLYERILPPHTAPLMVERALEAVKDPFVYNMARNLVAYLVDERQSPYYSVLSEAEAIYLLTWNGLRYTRDPLGVELVYDTTAVIEFWKRIGRWAEDCDSFALTTLTFLFALGRMSRVVIAGFEPSQPHWFSHVFVQVLLPWFENYYEPTWCVVDASLKPSVVDAMASDIKHAFFFYPPGLTGAEDFPTPGEYHATY